MLVAVAALAATLFATVSPAAGYAGFGDVEGDAFYTEGVQWMTNNDITQGVTDTCFAPYDAVTRGQAATFMWRMVGEPAAPSSSFDDVPNGAFFADAVDWMVDQDITQGFDADTFGPARPLTRGQFATFLWRLEGEPNAPKAGFGDVPGGAYFERAVNWMVAENITQGFDANTFGPDATVTRGQVATFLHRYRETPSVFVVDDSPICGADPSERDEFNGSFGLTGWQQLGDDRATPTFSGTQLMFDSAFGEIAFRRPGVAPEWQIETVLTFSPTASGQRAGLIVTDSDDFKNYVNIVREFDQGLVFNSRTPGGFRRVQPAAFAGTTVHLRLRFEAGAFSGQYSADGVTWSDLGFDPRGSMSNPRVGVYGAGGSATVASFDFFENTALCDPDVC